MNGMVNRSWLAAFAAYKTLVFGLAFVGLAAFAHLWPESPTHFAQLFYEWDAKHILRVARDGYLAAEPSIQVLPLFPLLIRLTHVIFRNWEWAGLIAAQICSFFAFYYFYLLARLEFGREQALTALVLFALFPTAYFLTAPYTEALYCATTFAAFYYLRTGQYRWAALAACLCAMTRITGLLFAGAVLVHGAQQIGILSSRKFNARATLPYALVAAGAFLGFGVYLALNNYLYGSSTYFLQQQAKHWGVHLAWPFKGAWTALAAWGTRTADQKMAIIVLEIGFMLLAMLCLPALWARKKLLEFSYVLSNLALLACMDFWLSRPRYILPLFPMFFVAAPWFAKSPIRIALYALGSAGLFGIYWAAYMNAQWAF